MCHIKESLSYFLKNRTDHIGVWIDGPEAENLQPYEVKGVAITALDRGKLDSHVRITLLSFKTRFYWIYACIKDITRAEEGHCQRPTLHGLARDPNGEHAPFPFGPRKSKLCSYIFFVDVYIFYLWGDVI